MQTTSTKKKPLTKKQKAKRQRKNEAKKEKKRQQRGEEQSDKNKPIVQVAQNDSQRLQKNKVITQKTESSALYLDEQDFYDQHDKEIVDYLDDLGLLDIVNDPDLLLFARIAFWRKNMDADDFLTKMGIPEADYLEFIGDAVLHAILTQQLANDDGKHVSIAARRMRIENNANLARYATNLQLCNHLASDKIKPCADIFEALIGAIYFELFYNKGLRYRALSVIEDWLSTVDPKTFAV